MITASHRISRILIHLLFWALFVFISLFIFSDYYWKENPFLQYFVILAALVYLNNELLLPFFVKRRMYLLYTITIGLIAVLATQLYCNYFAQCGCSITKCLSDYLWQTLVPLVFFSFIWMLFRYLEHQDEMDIIKKENTEMELHFLKSQINPHVLFNNLNTIYSYALEKPQQVPGMILMLSNNLKHVLYESNTVKIDLRKELDYIDNYIAFQKIRTENIKKIDYSVVTDTDQYEIAPLLLITIIENAFKHSAANSTINIEIEVKNAVLRCTCSNKNDVKGKQDNSASIGLKNLKKRLYLLYRNKHELIIDDREEYTIHLKLELE